MAQPAGPSKVTADPLSQLKASLTFGAWTGCAGLGVGSIGGVLRSNHPVLFAMFSGAQWFALGTVYWASRSAMLEAWADRKKREASLLAGAFSGATIAGATRGRSNVLPAALMFGVFGFLGQVAYERLDASHAASVQTEQADGSIQSVLTSIGKSRWSPIKLLDDQEYEQMMRDKILRVDAELAVIEEDIAELQRRKEAANGSEAK